MDGQAKEVGDRGQGDDEEEIEGACGRETMGRRGGNEVCCCSQEEKGKKLERAHRAKEAMEENPDSFRKGKWPRCT